LRGILQRFPQLYRPLYEDSLADYGGDALTEGLGLFDGSGPGRGRRYNYGFTASLCMNEPVGNSRLRVVAGARACIAFCKDGADKDAVDYKTDGDGACSFRIVAARPEAFDVSFSCPNVDISRFPVTVNGRTLNESEARRPVQAPSSLYLTALRDGDVVTIGKLPDGLRATNFTTLRTYSEGKKRPHSAGSFVMTPVPGEVALPQDWNDLHSFAGLVPGEHWIFGVPYWLEDRAATNPIPIQSLPGGSTLFAAYVPKRGSAPRLILSGGEAQPLAGQPAVAWRAWPPIFDRKILFDRTEVAPGAKVKALDPNGSLLMAFTVCQGDARTLAAVTNALAAAAADVEIERRDEQRLAGMRRVFARLPDGKIALLPDAKAGPGANFAARTGLRKKWVRLAPQDFVSAAKFNAARFPVAFYLGDERYLRTVNEDGDGEATLVRYLAGGGTLVLLSSGPYPLFYGDPLGAESGPPSPVLPRWGLPLTMETAPEKVLARTAPAQKILRSVPARFAFLAGDTRLRAGQPSQYDAANHYTPMIEVVNDNEDARGDAAFYVELGAGPAKGGKLLYLWSSLLASPQGNAIMDDTVGWVLEKTIAPNL
jgi:hypothetical protein